MAVGLGQSLLNLHLFKSGEQGGVWLTHAPLAEQTLQALSVAAFSLMSCCWRTKIVPAPSPPTRTRSPRMVAITFFPPNFLGFPTGVTTGGMSKEGAADPAPESDGGGKEASPVGISIGGGATSETGVGFTGAGLALVSVGLFWSGI